MCAGLDCCDVLLISENTRRLSPQMGPRDHKVRLEAGMYETLSHTEVKQLIRHEHILWKPLIVLFCREDVGKVINTFADKVLGKHDLVQSSDRHQEKNEEWIMGPYESTDCNFTMCVGYWVCVTPCCFYRLSQVALGHGQMRSPTWIGRFERLRSLPARR